MKFVLTPRAEQDLSEIRDYIASDNVEAAVVLDTLEKAIERLAKNPAWAASQLLADAGTWALIQRLTRASRTSSGSAPPERISSWKALRSNLAPSCCLA